MPRPREFDETEVITQATKVFWELGYRRTTPRLLMEATGLSKSSLYAAFGSKQGIFEVCLEFYVQQHEKLIKGLLADKSLRDGLASIYANTIKMVTTQEGPSNCLVCSSAIELDGVDSAVYQDIANARERMESVIIERLELAQQSGEIAAHQDPQTLAQFLYSMYMGIIVMGRAGSSAQQLENIVNMTLATVCE